MYCKSCGYENEDDATICENCGAELNSFYGSDSEKLNRRKKILLIVVAIIILFIGISVIFTLENYNESRDPRAINQVCPYCGAGSDTMVAVSENSSHIKWYCQYCDNTWWELIPKEQ